MPVARPRKDIADRRTGTLRVRLSPREEARFLTRAAEARCEPSEFARQLLCPEILTASNDTTTATPFEVTDALLRLGADLQRLITIAERTGQMPPGLDSLLARLEVLIEKVLGP
jgi:hypothetical protein